MSVQLHTYAMNRLAQWAIYRLWRADLLAPGPGPAAMKSWWFGIVMSANVRVTRESFTQRIKCPVDEVECGITELCVQQLPEELRAAVEMANLSGGTAEEKALELGWSRRTYFRRLNQAYAELIGLFNDHEAGVRRVSVDEVNAELEASRLKNASAEGTVRSGEHRRPITRGIARALLLDKNGTPT